MHVWLFGFGIGMVILVEQPSLVGYRINLKSGFLVDTHFQTPSPSLVGGYAAALKPQPQWQPLGMLLPRSWVSRGSYCRHDSRLGRGRILRTTISFLLLSQCLGIYLRLGKVVSVVVEVVRKEVYLS